MLPQRNQFRVSFAPGEKAVAVARASKLVAAVMEAIDAGPRYAEGRGVRLEVRNSRLLPSLVTLARIKVRS